MVKLWCLGVAAIVGLTASSHIVALLGQVQQAFALAGVQ